MKAIDTIKGDTDGKETTAIEADSEVGPLVSSDEFTAGAPIFVSFAEMDLGALVGASTGTEVGDGAFVDPLMPKLRRPEKPSAKLPIASKRSPSYIL